MDSSHYLQLARECIQEAESIPDEERKKTLLGIAKLYHQTALAIEASNPPTIGVRQAPPIF